MKKLVVCLCGTEEVALALTRVKYSEFDCFDMSPGLIKEVLSGKVVRCPCTLFSFFGPH